MSEVDLEDRQRVDRWLEESQYLLGRLIPGYIDDRERLKTRLTSSEEESDRLRHEIEGKLSQSDFHAAMTSSVRHMYGAIMGQFALLLGVAYFFVSHVPH